VLKDNVIYVFTPPVKINKPSVDVSALNYEVKKGYFKTSEAQENLKRSIKPLLSFFPPNPACTRPVQNWSSNSA